MLLGVAVTLTLRLAFPAPPPSGVLVPTAVRDLPVGTVLAPGDLRERRWPGAEAPARPDALESLVGRRLAAPLAAGDVVTQRAVQGRAALTGLRRGTVAVPVGGVPPVVRAQVATGDAVQLWAGGRLVAGHALVLAVEPGGSGGAGSGSMLSAGPSGATSGATLLVALPEDALAAWQSARGSSPDDRPLEVALVAR